ncbi:MAG: 16S rRNA (cytidine(1402)-2'-O)-methyltransferase [Candidatus Woesearchaeota archaeon]
MLYLVPTPIGNREDITYRAVRIMGEADLVACEDTRRTGLLLKHHGIKNKLESFHEHNEKRKIPRLMQLLRDGKTIALVTDSGMPSISDPGVTLVRACRKEGIEVSALPGPSAFVTAISGSGFPTHAVSFYGFVPKKQGRREEFFRALKDRQETITCYESPYRIQKTLAIIEKHLPEWQVCVCREISKRFEEYAIGTAAELQDKIKPKGEFVLVLHSQGMAS